MLPIVPSTWEVLGEWNLLSETISRHKFYSNLIDPLTRTLSVS